MSAAFRASLAALALGLTLGTWSDRDPGAPAPERRDGWYVLEADLHAHTRFSDGLLSPFDLTVHARRQRLHVLGVTEHNMVFPAQLVRWFARHTGGPIVLVGEEITSAPYHVHAFGIEDRVLPRRSLDAVIDAVHAQGGVVIAAHPVAHFWPALLPVRHRLDGAEILHPIALRAPREGWDWAQMESFFQGSLAQGHRLTAVGASDYHGFSPLGLCRTLLFAREPTERGALDALREGRTVVVDHRGVSWGDPALVASLRARPYRSVARAGGYPSSGALDRVGRALGLAGLLGVTFTRRRRS